MRLTATFIGIDLGATDEDTSALVVLGFDGDALRRAACGFGKADAEIVDLVHEYLAPATVVMVAGREAQGARSLRTERGDRVEGFRLLLGEKLGFISPPSDSTVVKRTQGRFVLRCSSRPSEKVLFGGQPRSRYKWTRGSAEKDLTWDVHGLAHLAAWQRPVRLDRRLMVDVGVNARREDWREALFAAYLAWLVSGGAVEFAEEPGLGHIVVPALGLSA